MYFQLGDCIVKEGSGVPGLEKGEVVLAKLCVEEYAIGQLGNHLKAQSTDADISYILNRVSKEGRPGVQLGVAQPNLIESGESHVMRALVVEVVLNRWNRRLR